MEIFGIIVFVLLGAVYVDGRIAFFSLKGIGLLVLLFFWARTFFPEDFGFLEGFILIGISGFINFIYRHKIEKI